MPFSLTIYGAHFLRLAIRIQVVENRFLTPNTRPVIATKSHDKNSVGESSCNSLIINMILIGF